MKERDPGEWLRTHRAPEDLLQNALRRGVRPRRSPLARASLAAALLLCGVGMGWAARGLTTEEQPPPAVIIAAGEAEEPESAPIPVRLVFHAPHARSVTVAGTFNGWDRAASPLVRGAQGTWHVLLPLSRGRHEYMFVVDGTTWVADPGAPLTQPDEFGNQNGVLQI